MSENAGVGGHRLLTPREKALLFLIANGYEEKEMSHVLYYSPAQIKYTLRQLRTEFAANDRAHLVATVFRLGLLSHAGVLPMGRQDHEEIERRAAAYANGREGRSAERGARTGVPGADRGVQPRPYPVPRGR